MYKFSSVLKLFSIQRSLKDFSHGTNRYLTRPVLRKTSSSNSYAVTCSFSFSVFSRSRNQGLQRTCCQYVAHNFWGYEVKVKQFPHWNSAPVSYISSSSFFENKHGFSESHFSDKGLMPSGYSLAKPWNIIPTLQTCRCLKSDSSKKSLRHTTNSSHSLASNLDQRFSEWKKDYKFCTVGECSDKIRSILSLVILSKVKWLVEIALPEGNGASSKKLFSLFMFCVLLMLYLMLSTHLIILPEIADYFPEMLLNTQVNDFYYQEASETFEDIKDIDEVKNMDEFKIIVAFLRNPQKFNDIGAIPPKGVLLTGPTGTGKTLFVQAVASEADVPFLKASGSNFEGLFVWQGPKRVRDLFKQAKSKAPCIIFIDEIDFIRAKCNRTPSSLYANDVENQLLEEVDGLRPTDGVIVMGAANHKGYVHKELLRPGRLDIQIAVDDTSASLNAV